MSDENMIIYAGWYTPQAWNRLRELVTDPENLAKKYEDFVTNFKRSVRDWEYHGESVTTVMIDPDHMAAWCKRQGIPLDSVGRAAYNSMLGAADGDKAKMDTMRLGDPQGLLTRVS